MRARRKLKLDPFFSDKFFSAGNVEDQFKPVDFTLPSTPVNLDRFFESDEGAIFKASMSDLIDRLKSWAEENEINPASLKTFRKNYINYSGGNANTNTLYFPLYSEGVPLLYNIVNLLESADISQSHCRKVIAELLLKMGLCPPGVHTYLYDAFAALVVNRNLPTSWEVFRRDLAQQAGIKLANKHNKNHVDNAWDAHYVNAVLNAYTDALAIKPIEDGYADMLAVRPTNGDSERIRRHSTYVKMLSEFKKHVKNYINAELLVDFYTRDKGADNFAETLNANLHNLEAVNAAIDEFEAEFNRFCEVDIIHKILYIDDVVRLNDNGEYRPTWKASYVIAAAIFNRLLQRHDCFDMDAVRTAMKTVHCGEERHIRYFANKPLSLAQAHLPNAKDHKYFQPFIPWCVETLSDPNVKSSRLFLFLMSGHFNSAQRHEIITAMSQYLSSQELKEEPDADERRRKLSFVLEKLFEAYENDRSQIFQIALDNGFINMVYQVCSLNFEMTQSQMQRALFAAVMTSRPEIIVELGKKGVNFGIADSHNKTVFHVAAEMGSIDALNVLLASDSSRKCLARDDANKSALSYAIEHGHEKAVQVLLDVGAVLTLADMELLNKDRDAGIARMLEQTRLATDAYKSINAMKLSPALIAARAKAIDQLKKAAIYLDAVAFTKLLIDFKERDNFLVVFCEYHAKNSNRIEALNEFERLLNTEYKNFSVDHPNAMRFLAFKNDVSNLIDRIKQDHKTNGALAKFGFFTTSRLAAQLERCVGEDFYLRKKMIGQ